MTEPIPVQFHPAVATSAIPEEVLNFCELVPWSVIDQSVKRLKQITKRNPYARDLATRNHVLELALSNLIIDVRRPGSLKRRMRHSMYLNLRAATFVASFVRYANCMPPEVRKQFVARVNGTLSSGSPLAPIEHELDCVSHLLQRGANVSANDLVGTGGFDYLLDVSGMKVPVECKMFSKNKGKRIHDKHLSELAKVMQKQIDAVAEVLTNRYGIVVVTVPSRLFGSPKELEGLSRSVVQAISEPEVAHESVHGSAQWIAVQQNREMFVRAIVEGQHRELAEVVQANTGLSNQAIIANVRANKGAVAIVVRSAKSDSLRKAYYEELKSAAKQIGASGGRGLILARIDGLSGKDMQELYRNQEDGKTNLLQQVITDLFAGYSEMVGGVVFIPNAEFVENEWGYATNYPCYSFFRDERLYRLVANMFPR